MRPHNIIRPEGTVGKPRTFPLSRQAISHLPSPIFHLPSPISRFVKNRNATDAECPTLEWTFLKAPNTPKVQVTWKKLTPLQQFRQCVEDGMVVGTQIAKHLGLSPGRVSQLANKAAKEGWLRKDGRHFAIKLPNPIDDWYNQKLEAARAKHP